MADSFLTSPESFNTHFSVIAANHAATGAPPKYAEFLQAAAPSGKGRRLFLPCSVRSRRAIPHTQRRNSTRLVETGPPAPSDGPCGTTTGKALASCFETLIGYPANMTPIGEPNNEFQNTERFHSGPDHTNALYINTLYFTILNQNPDPTGFSSWLSVANGGGPGILFQGNATRSVRIQILGPGTPGQGFIGSSEF